MWSVFENEDYIYISEIHPVPDLRLGEARLGLAWPASHTFCLCAVSVSWIGWALSLEKDKKDTNPRPGQTTG